MLVQESKALLKWPLNFFTDYLKLFRSLLRERVLIYIIIIWHPENLQFEHTSVTCRAGS